MDTSFVKISDILAKIEPELVTESPIETDLLKEFRKLDVPCQTQFKIGPYRADIFIDSKYRKIVVECDGEAFHQDKDKDAKRDAYMEKRGYLVLRFTGKQIKGNAKECAMKVIENISEIYCSRKYQSILTAYLEKITEEDEENIDQYEAEYGDGYSKKENIRPRCNII